MATTMVKTRVLKIDRHNFQPEELDSAREAIEAGELVAFPTETVYGIAADASNRLAVEKLTELKSREPDKPFTLHIGSMAQLSRFVGPVTPMGRFLIKRYWPGPLTIVFPTRASAGRKVNGDFAPLAGAAQGKSSIGVRYPCDKVAQALLVATRSPVIAPSANPADEQPAATGKQALKYFGGLLAVVVDAGPSRLGKPSSVVRVGRRSLDILREGAIPASELQALRLKTALLVCTGNTCRSPMAEGLFKLELAGRLGVGVEELEGLGFQVYSAGTAAGGGGRASAEAVKTMRQKGYNLSNHLTKPLTLQMLEEADMVIVMTHGHLQDIRAVAPEAARKAALVDPHGIADPIGQPIEVYLGTADRIQRGLRRFVDKLLSSER